MVALEQFVGCIGEMATAALAIDAEVAKVRALNGFRFRFNARIQERSST
jgi:hypothetical protein